MTLFSRSPRHNVHVCVHRHYSQCWATLQTLDENSLGLRGEEKKTSAKHATCCFLLPWPLSVLTQRACLYAGGHVIVCMCVGRRRKRVSFVFAVGRRVQRDSGGERQRGSLGAVGVRLCSCVELHTCASVTDWLAARFHRPSAVASPEIAGQSGKVLYYFPALAPLSFLPVQLVGHTRRSMPNTLPSIPLTF